jgi:creatinine amidohydrolase
MEKLVTDILKVFPPGQLPPMDLVTERDREELEVILKGPARGGKSIYSLGWPP